MISLFVITLLLRFTGASTPSDGPGLVHSAKELLRNGQPAKALVLLQRARSLDSTQVDLDRLATQCNFQLGNWVPLDAESEWTSSDDRFLRAIREKPDSMFQVSRKAVDAENLAEAVRICWKLSESHAASPDYLKAYTELRGRQDMKIAFHRDLAQKALSRGEVMEATNQWRMAYAARPDDRSLRDLVEKAEQTQQLTLQLYQRTLQTARTQQDERSTMDVLRKARIVFPGVAPFQKLFDSLDALQRASRSARLDQINTLADQGRDQEATEAMEALIETDPREPALAIAQEALHARIQKRRGRIQIAELSRSCDLAVQGGDLTKAEAVYANLKKAGADGSESDRLRQRIDSLGAASRSGNAFSTAMVSSRQALKAGDVASARAFLQKALTVQPDNIVAKGLLGSLANVRTGNGASTNGLTTTNAPKSVKAPPSTEDGTRAKELLLAGVAAYRSGQYAKAVESWKQVRALDPTNIQAQKYLANVGLKQTRLK